MVGGFDLKLPIPKNFDIDTRTTVDGRNPAPPQMYETLEITGKTTYQLLLVQDFFHQQ